LPRIPQTLQRKPQYEDWVINDLPFDPTLSASNPLYEGDLVYWSGLGILPINSGTLGTDTTFLAKMSKFMGMSKTTVPLGFNPNDVLAPGGIASGYYGALGYDGIQVVTRCIADMFTTVGDTYFPFDEVTIGANAQTIVKTATVAPNQPSLVSSGTGSTLTVGAHTVKIGYFDNSGNIVYTKSQTQSTTSGQNIVATITAIPSWAIGAVAVIDGNLGVPVYTGTVITISAQSATPAPVNSTITVGTVLPSASNYTTMVGTGQAGALNTTVRVALRALYPNNLGLL
jgi:hypothetical protein